MDVKPVARKSLSMVLFQTLGDYRSPYKLLRSFIISDWLVVLFIFLQPGAWFVYTSSFKCPVEECAVCMPMASTAQSCDALIASRRR